MMTGSSGPVRRVYTRYHVRRSKELLTVHGRSARGDAIRGDDQPDRCRFQSAFDSGRVPCAAFQSLPFMAATSYGKPLGTHIACAHLRAAESARNQFYPRCALGGDRERLRWVATIGPGKVEVIRSLQADFEVVASRYRPRLVAAKATLLTEAPLRKGPARDVLAALTGEFISAIETFVSLNASRISESGLSPAALNRIAADALLEWRGNRRLDLPGIDEHWISPVEPEVELVGAEVVNAAGLWISTSTHPPALRLSGEVDQANLSVLAAALESRWHSSMPVHVDVSGLTFCSVAGMRLLMEAVGSGNVQLVGIPPHLASAFNAADFPAVGAA
jgi:ABC-type transporter Mla MlaB component